MTYLVVGVFFIVILPLCIVMCAIVILFYIAVFDSIIADVPFVSTPHKIRKQIVSALELNAGSVLYDLGCGNAKILIDAALSRYPTKDITCIGIERGIFAYLVASFYIRKNKVRDSVSIRRENIFKTDLSSATHIYMYLNPYMMEKMFSKLKAECKSGTRIVSCDFQFAQGQIQPIQVIDLVPTEKLSDASIRGKRLFIYKL